MLHHKMNCAPRMSSVNWMSWPREVGMVFSNLLLSISIHTWNKIQSTLSWSYHNINIVIFSHRCASSKRWLSRFYSQRLMIFNCLSFPISVGIVSMSWLPSTSYKKYKKLHEIEFKWIGSPKYYIIKGGHSKYET